MQWWLWLMTCLLCGTMAWYIGRRQAAQERDRDREREQMNQSVEVQVPMSNHARQNLKEEQKDVANQQQQSFNNQQSLSFSSTSVKSEKESSVGETGDLQLISGVFSQGSGRRRIRKRESS